MDKIILIIKREYLTRVRKRSFIIMSLIGPLLMASMFVVPIWLATRQSEKKVVKVIDESGYFTDQLKNNSTIEFIFIREDIVSAKKNLKSEEAYGVLYIPKISLEKPEGISFFCDKNPSLDVIGSIEGTLRSRVEDIKLQQSEISKELLESLKSNLTINSINVSESGEKASSAGIATAVGYISSLLIYFFILFYGIQVMRGVIEEKTSRIVEIIISSVKPFQLMAGKIIGIGAVGLTQFVIWIVLGMGITTGIGSFFGPQNLAAVQTGPGQAAQAAGNPDFINELFSSIGAINMPLIIVAFLFYFIAAYILYGALFAAVGSAVDSDSDAQQFQLPITIPLIISIIVLAAVLKEPDGSLAFWMSIIPLFSPIVMMMRLPFGVPWWELGLSVGLLIAGFLFTIWIAGRIYRVGILTFGSKVSYRILLKWLFLKN
jgi:ABC-2 type transport system permease protein